MTDDAPPLLSSSTDDYKEEGVLKGEGFLRERLLWRGRGDTRKGC